jgi:Tol biopolymer transport system component
MTARDDFDRTLGAWLTAQAPVREPEHLLDHVLARTARTRRRPGWRIPERWTFMTALTQAIPRSPVPWRTLGLVALLILGLVAAALLAIGSQYRRLPPPFGVAGNGSLIYALDGQIVSRAGPSSPVVPVVTGSAPVDGPVIAPDGSKFVFGRHGSGDLVDEWVANADGTGQRKLDVPFQTISWVDWSPNSDELFVANENGQTAMAIVPADGSHSTTLDFQMPTMVPVHRPGHPDQILFRGQDSNTDWGLFLVGRDGVSPKRLDLDAGFRSDDAYGSFFDSYFQGPVWTSDGKTLMYFTREPRTGQPGKGGLREHVATIGPAGEVIDDTTLQFDPSADDEWGAQWLPAEDGIVFQSQEADTHTLKLHRSSMAQSETRDLGVTATDWIGYVISPDGKSLVAMLPAAGGGAMSLELIDLQTFTATPLDISSEITWQRVAR